MALLCAYGETLSIIFSHTPYFGVVTKKEILECLDNIEDKGLLQSIISLETQKKQYKTVLGLNVSLDTADDLIISRALSDYYNQCIEIDYDHMCHAWNINSLLKLCERKNIFSKKILLSALKMGYKVSDQIVQDAKLQNEISLQILCATYLFCNANYIQAKVLLEKIMPQINHRTLKVMYAISLNRCRIHEIAEQKLSELIETSSNIDETTILVSFLISNHVHNRKIFAARELYIKYSKSLKSSIKYPYFLRNVATIFSDKDAFTIRNNALKLFEESGDNFGYYSTIINMANYLIRNKPMEYCINILQKAFDSLQKYNASQIHLAANNLGVCYLFAKDNWNAIKYLTLSLEKAQTIMPKSYAAVNLSAIFLQNNQIDKACEYLANLAEDVRKTNLARLKAHFYLQYALIEYINDNLPRVNFYIINTLKYCAPNESAKIYKAANKIKSNIQKKIKYSNNMFFDIYVPCYLEYWTINSIDVLSDDFLPE